jgi:hypothetical protein
MLKNSSGIWSLFVLIRFEIDPIVNYRPNIAITSFHFPPELHKLLIYVLHLRVRLGDQPRVEHSGGGGVPASCNANVGPMFVER